MDDVDVVVDVVDVVVDVDSVVVVDSVVEVVYETVVDVVVVVGETMEPAAEVPARMPPMKTPGVKVKTRRNSSMRPIMIIIAPMTFSSRSTMVKN